MKSGHLQHPVLDQASGLPKRNPFRTTGRLWLLFIAATLSLVVVATKGPASGQSVAAPRDYLNTRPGVEYVGDESCRQCHRDRYESFKKTGMGRSMSRPGPGDLGASSDLIIPHGEKDNRKYSVYVEGGRVFHQETQFDSNHKPIFTEKHEVAYTVGSGEHGRSYLIRRGDFLFLSPLSFYTAARKWDVSPGIESELYRGFTRPAGNLCVSCHSGLSQPVPGTMNQYREPPFLMLSIGCERCHGPGSLHVADRRAGKPVDTAFDRSIVNPRNLPSRLRDDVCYQCHLAGDARVQRSGKTYLDFRPGKPLDEVVSIFLVPPKSKPGGFQALSQPEQLQMSRCRQQDGTKLNCITCHDPHVQKFGIESASYFNGKCVKCHAPEGGRFAAAHRTRERAAGSCTACHMPKKEVSNVAHTALTDHRILINPGDVEKGAASDQQVSASLIWATQPAEESNPDLRTMALAFAQLAPHYPGYGERGFPFLERAARELPDDMDIQMTYGEVLMMISPKYRASAKQAFERAITAGSKSAAVRRRLARLLIEEGDPKAIELIREAIRLEPYNAAGYLQLANAFVQMGNRTEAVRALEQALKVDPGNPETRKLLRELTPRR